jgi:hypothetical protein
MKNIDFHAIYRIMRQFDFPTQLTITQHGEFPSHSYTVDVYKFSDYPNNVAECVYSATFDAL